MTIALLPSRYSGPIHGLSRVRLMLILWSFGDSIPLLGCHASNCKRLESSIAIQSTCQVIAKLDGKEKETLWINTKLPQPLAPPRNTGCGAPRPCFSAGVSPARNFFKFRHSHPLHRNVSYVGFEGSC